MTAKLNTRRVAAFRALWQALRSGQRPGTPGLGERASALPRMLRDGLSGRYPGLGKGRVALFLLGVAYLVSPVDLVPELVVPLLGFGDDGLVALWLAGSFLAETGHYLDWERELPDVVEGRVQ